VDLRCADAAQVELPPASLDMVLTDPERVNKNETALDGI
jgi:hypothetical protein